MPSVLAQGNSTCYEPPAINFHLGETPPREPQGGGEHTARAALFYVNRKQQQRRSREDNVTDRQRVSAASPSFLACVATLLAALTLVAAPARAADPIKIGFSMALTG